LGLREQIQKYIRLDDPRNEFPDTFREELNYQSRYVLTFGAIISFGWIPYIPIDLMLHPDEPFIIVLRVGFIVLGILLFFTRFIAFFRNRSLLLLTLFGGYLEVATGLLTGLSKGDPAYIGGFLFVLTLIAVCPFPRRPAYILLGLALLSFFVTGYFNGMSFYHYQGRYSLNDILATAVVCAFFVYILDSIRFQSWEKSKKIERAQSIITEQKNQLEKQISIAGELQSALLPRNIPVIQGIKISYRYQPMMGLGGDFIDVHYSPDKKGIGLFICDVSGHGVSGALVASMVKISLNRWGESVDSPAQTLRHIYGSIKGKMGGNFVSAGICYLDTTNGKLCYASAGHPHSILVSVIGEVKPFVSRGRVIADIMTPNYEEVTLQLEYGDRIIMYTDGVTEVFNRDGKMLGEEGFVKIVQKHCFCEPEVLCGNIFMEISRFTQNNIFYDDITLLVLEYSNEA
jgi:serine phosphatase RsbU (regulator of sigma subunit)